MSWVKIIGEFEFHIREYLTNITFSKILIDRKEKGSEYVEYKNIVCFEPVIFTCVYLRM